MILRKVYKFLFVLLTSSLGLIITVALFGSKRIMAIPGIEETNLAGLLLILLATLNEHPKHWYLLCIL